MAFGDLENLDVEVDLRASLGGYFKYVVRIKLHVSCWKAFNEKTSSLCVLLPCVPPAPLPRGSSSQFMQTLVLLFTSMFLNKIFMLLFPGYQLLTSVDLPFMEDGFFPFMPLSLSPFPSSQYCYMKSPSEINSHCHIVW